MFTRLCMHLGFVIAALVLSLPSPVLAASRPADCTLIVDGKSYIDGACEFSPDGDAGSFSIYGDKYWAVVNVENGKGEASWNGEPYATSAQAELGDVHRVGGCWEGSKQGSKIRICARAMDETRRDAIMAGRPKGMSISPAYEGYLCASVPGYRFEPGAVLVMDRCDQFLGLRQRVFHLSEGKISFEGKPGLCIDARSLAGKKETRLVLDDCARVATQWTYDKDQNAIRSNNNLCWDIVFPEHRKQKGDWSSPMIAHPCDKDGEKNGHFEFRSD